MKIEDFIKKLPQNIVSGQDVQLPENSFRDIFQFIGLSANDIFYHLGCGDGLGLEIALNEFGVKKVVGIDNDKDKIQLAKNKFKKASKNVEIIFDDIVKTELKDPTIILFWFTDEEIINKMMDKFVNLPSECKIITIWGPLPGCLPHKVDFPYIINKTPFVYAKDLQEQLLSIFGVKCVDFVTAWEYAERYTKALGKSTVENDRFLTIIQSLIIWINAKNLGVACGDEMPESIKTYIGILRTFFGIEVEHLLER